MAQLDAYIDSIREELNKFSEEGFYGDVKFTVHFMNGNINKWDIDLHKSIKIIKEEQDARINNSKEVGKKK